MNVKVKGLKDSKGKSILVECYDEDCPNRKCFWARPDPGRFTVGRGYHDAKPGFWLCGTREIHGCPDDAFEEGK